MSLIPKNGKVAVVGAGISGLTYSYFLLKLRPDVSISILESLARPGGWISTEKLNDAGKEIILEKGPRTLRGVSDGTLLIVDILRHLQLENQVEVMKSTSIANRKWLLDLSNNLVQVPNSVSLLLKFLGSDVTDGLVRGVLREPFRSKLTDAQDESIQSFFQRRFGSPEIADNILSAVMHGIYSGNVAKLSVQTTLPSLVEMEKKDGSIVKSMLRRMRSQKNKVLPTINETLAQYELLISPDSNLGQLSQSLKKFPILRLQDGLQVLPNALAELLLRQNNITINYESEVDSLDLKSGALLVNGKKDNYDHVRFTLGAARLLEVVGRDPELQQVLNLFEYSSIFMANVYSKKGGLIPAKGNGFGFLVPSRNSNPESLLGVIFDSDTELDAEKFFGGSQVAKVSYDKVTLMMGGHYFNERGIPSTSINLRAARNVLSSILGVKLDNYNIILRDEATENSKEVKLEDNDLLISYNLHKNCIPQYNVGFLDKVKSMVRIVDEKSKRKVSIGGTSLGKLGVPDCVMNSLEDALAQGR
ncbi:CIC11C00000005326 [Sungouiella intermedia]|uniref:Protoporphyrinogen oxidase n=1 Tax=Sungouiella intermedia TaxID=45354 RepID=A0A1L0FU52_9ASCO|nr:CIC11C00000005326 [[Candida] intermedia]